MPRPLHEWDEEYVLALPSGENGSFERKGAKKLDLTVPGVKEGEVLDELAKQLSAFANSGGGHIIYGVSDAGQVDNGGVALSVKGRQPTKDWLESVIRNLTEFQIMGCNVHPILRKADASKIDEGKAIYVIEVPDSDGAPHQSSRDSKYYVRLGGNSVPATHRMVEDIRTRRRHPVLELRKIKLQVFSIPPFEVRDPQTWEGEFSVMFDFTLKNAGRMMARNTCLRISPSFLGLRWDYWDRSTLRLRGDSSMEAFFELCDPVYPEMEIGFRTQASLLGGYGAISAAAPFGGPWYIGQQRIEASEARLDLQLFADNAPAMEATLTLTELDFEKRAIEALKDNSQATQIRHAFPRLRF